MKLKKQHLAKIIENFLFEKKQKIDKKFLEKIVSKTSVKHDETGIEYTIGKDLLSDGSMEEVILYRHDIDNPKKKVINKVSYKKFLDEYSLV